MKRNRKILIVSLLVLVIAGLLFGTGCSQKEVRDDFSYPAQEQTITPLAEPAPTPNAAPAKSPETGKPEVAEESIALPVEPEAATTSTEAKTQVTAEVQNPESPTCTLSVRCDDVLNHMDKLAEAKRGMIPENGVIFQAQAVTFSEGESVFDVLLRELKKKKIHLEFVNNPMYNSAYIEGIGNLYEFDCGDTSGWIYKVNGVEPRHGCSQYKLKSGDAIEFFYRCSMFD